MENEKTEDIELKTIELIVTECDDQKPTSTSAPSIVGEPKRVSWLDLSLQNQSLVSLRSGFWSFLSYFYSEPSDKGAQ